MPHPNILLIYADQQRHDTIGALGNAQTVSGDATNWIGQPFQWTTQMSGWYSGSQNNGQCRPRNTTSIESTPWMWEQWA